MPRFTALTLSNPPSKKRYVTRACDSCRKRKSRCNGLAPCSRCKGCGNVCSYDMPYTRGHAQTEVSDSERNQSQTSQASSPPPYSENSASANGLALDSNASEFAEMPVDQGDASIQSFLRKVSSHLSRVGRIIRMCAYFQTKKQPVAI
ncbi:hypothetical protein LMH87_004797 [Akanthomyces muscarius]|uniref:Zn(2)-C6 fungal-type domain-containing protein n=1 Tax=Akanthomyces muscarius TaxID=2231603 RepID=A0A9W8UHD4_AKAMU|nr:hypothetical protein LMH87_004797 [Akanthomyces muscarius]KAJ4145966.1 hypothetical protein LMH87_004797 [Akanthomyces muscarius]